MLILDMMLADYDDGFSVQRSSIISTDFPKHLLSIAKNIVVCNKTRNSIGAVVQWSGVLFIGTEVEQSTHMMQTPWGWPGPWEASFVLQFNILIKE